jgi:pimeloyl-ACP methyl ester carboxylesterase
MQTHCFERPEGTLAYSDYGGDGPLVLMLPGMGALRSEYRFLAPRLREAGYHAITVDLRGQGESSVPWTSYEVPSVGDDILALTEHLNAEAAHVIGTSFAAAPAVWAAAECPDRIRSLVLIGAFVRQAKINPIMNALLWLMLNNPWRVRLWAMYYGTLYPTHKPADFKDYLNQLTENMKQPGRFDAVVALGNSPRQPSEERLKQVKAPTLVIMGTKDPDFPDPAAEGKYIAEQTGGHLELIEGAGHYPQTEIPGTATPIVIDFLDRSDHNELQKSRVDRVGLKNTRKFNTA